MSLLNCLDIVDTGKIFTDAEKTFIKDQLDQGIDELQIIRELERIFNKDMKNAIGDTPMKQKKVFKPAQVIIPNKYKGSIPLLEGTNIIDMSKVSPEVLKGFSYRIPTQEYSSMAAIEIVGFHNGGDIVYAPSEFNVQMGSDYDFDKLNVFTYDIDFSEGRLTKKDNNNNSLLDIELEIMSNEKIDEFTNTPLSSQKLKDVMPKAESTNLPKIYDDNFTNKYIEAQDGSTGIGVFARLSTLISTLSNIKDDVKFNIQNNILFKNDKRGSVLLNKPTSEDGRLKLEVSSQFLSAAVDNEKEPILGRINANNDTFDVISTMILLGYNEETIVKFITQPIVKQYIQNKNLIREQGETNEDVVKMRAETQTRIALEESTEEIINVPESTSISEIGSTEPDIQMAQLNHFISLESAGKEIRKVQKVVATDSSGLPKSIIESTDVESLMKGLPNIKIDNIEQVIGEYNKAGNQTWDIKPTTISGFANVYGLQYNNQLWREVGFPYDTVLMNTMYDKLENLGDLTAGKKKRLFNALKNYIYTASITDKENPVAEERRRLLMGDNSLARRVMAMQKKSNNRFINSLRVRLTKVKGEPDYVEFNNAAQPGINENYLYDAFNALLFGDEETKKLADDLIKYTMLTNVNSDPRSFAKFIPIEYYDVSGVIDNLNNFAFTKENDGFFVQFIRHNPDLAKFVELDESEKNKKIIRVPYNSVRVDDGIARYVSNDGQLYRFESTPDRNQVTYKRINTLGKGRVTEYNGDLMNEDYTSIFKENNVVKADSQVGPEEIPESTGKELIVDDEDANTPFFVDYNFESFDDTLDSIIDQTTNEKIKGVAQLLRRVNIENKPRIYIDPDMNGLGQYNSDNNVIRINSRSRNRGSFENTVIHEAIHGITARTIRDFEQGNEINEQQKTYLRQLEGLRTKYQQNVIKEVGPDVFDSFSEKMRVLESGTQEEQAALFGQGAVFNEKEALLYPASNLREFVVAVFTNNKLQDRMNNSKFDGKKTVFERLVEIIEKFLTSFGLKPESSLNEAIANSIGLFSSISLESTAQQPSLEEELDSDPDIGRISQEMMDLLTQRSNEIPKKTFKLNEYQKALSTIRKANQKFDMAGEPIRAMLKQENNSYTIEVKPVYNSDTVDNRIEDEDVHIINELKKDLRFVKNRITLEKNSVAKEKLIATANQLEDQIDEAIKQKATVSVIAKTGEEQLKNVQDLLNTSLLTPELLIQSIRTLSLWSKGDQYFLDESDLKDPNKARSKAVKDIKALKKKADSLIQDTWLGKAKAYAQELGNYEGVEQVLSDFEEDINVLQREFLPLEDTRGFITQTTALLLRNAATNAQLDAEQDYEEIDKVSDDFESSEFFKKYGYDIFIKDDGRLVSRFKQDFFNERKKLRDKAYYAKNNRQKLWNDYHEWLAENTTTVDVRKLYKENLETGEIEKVENKKEIKRLEERLGAERAQRALLEADVLMQIYEDRIRASIDEINNASYTDEFTSEQEIAEHRKNLIENKRKEISPFYRVEATFDKTNLVDSNGKFINPSYDYVYSLPNESWVDPDFDIIESWSETIDGKERNIAKEYYDWYSDRMRNYYKLAPDHIYKEFEYNELPLIPKNLIEDIFTGKFDFSKVTGVADMFMDVIREKRLDNSNLDEDRMNSRKEYSLDFPFRKRDFLTEGAESRAIGKSSKNLRKVMKVVAKEVNVYSHKKDIEDKVLLLEQLMNKQRERNKDEGRSLPNKKEQLSYAITSRLYNATKGTKFNFYLSGKKTYTQEEKRILKELEVEMEKADTPEKRQRVMNKIEGLGSKISSRKTSRFMLNLTQLVGMGWNPFSAMIGVQYGVVSNYMWAAGGDDFTTSDMNRALKVMMESSKNVLPGVGVGAILGTLLMPGMGTVIGAGLGSFIPIALGKKKNTSKTNNAMNFFDALNDGIDVNDIDKDYYKGESGFFSKIGPYEMQRKAEFMNYGLTLTAMMMAEKVQTNKGEMRLYDVFTDNMKIKEGLEVEGWMGDDRSGYTKFKNKFDFIARKLHGNYDKNAVIKFKEHTLGQGLLQFRSWMTDGIDQRFGNGSKDESSVQLGRVYEGRYKVYNFSRPDALKNAIKTLRRAVYLKTHKDAEGLSDVEFANLKRNVFELQAILITLATGIVLKLSLDDDDDDLKDRMGRFALNNIYRLYGDLTFFVNPTSVSDVNRQLIPAFRTLQNFDRVANYGVKIMLSDDVNDQTHEALQRAIAKTFPITTQVASTKSKLEEVFD